MATNILPMLSIILPFAAGVIMLFMGKRPIPHRIVSTIASAAMIVASLIRLYLVYTDRLLITYLGNFAVLLDISINNDMATALLVLTTEIILFFIVIYSFQLIGYEREKYYYYPMVMFIITGINGAFTTGDIF